MIATDQYRHVICLIKGEEKYIFLYDAEHQPETIRRLGMFASNPDLSFTWYDAAVLNQRIRQEAMKAKGGLYGKQNSSRQRI